GAPRRADRLPPRRALPHRALPAGGGRPAHRDLSEPPLRHALRHGAVRKQDAGRPGRALGQPRVTKALVAWSSGKDSAFALAETLRAGELEVAGLLTTVTADYERVSMHGVREEVLELQARRRSAPSHRADSRRLRQRGL